MQVKLQVNRLTGRLVQWAWLAFAVLALGLALAGLPHHFAELQAICHTSRCIQGQFTDEQMAYFAARGTQVDAGFLSSEAISTIAYNSILHLFIFGLAAVLIWQKPRHVASALTAYVFVALAVMLSGLPAALARVHPTYELPVRLLRFLELAGLLLVFCIMPDGRFGYTWLRWLAALFVAACFFFVVMAGVTLDMPIASDNALFGVIVAMAALIVTTSLALKLKAAGTEIERQQLKWILVGASIAIVWIAMEHVLYLFAPLVTHSIWSTYLVLMDKVVGSAFTGCVAVAVLQFQLFDIDIAINRGLVYGGLTLFIVVAYALIVGGLSVAFAQLAPADNAMMKTLLPLIATILIVLAFQPLRDRLQRAVNRLMYGERDEPYQVLTRLGQRLEAALEPASALPLTVETVAHALKLPYVAIRLKQDNIFQPVAAYGTPQNQVTRFPLIHASETIGELVAAPRAAEESFTEADCRLLGDLARQISVTAHGVLLSADLERARLRIVGAREEARRRLGSDLHDGVGHQLAGLSRKVESIASLLERDPAAARALLNETAQQIKATTAQVRSLAHQLHPPELELLGLVAALRERIQEHGPGEQGGPVIRLDAPEELPNLPTAIQVAAYYIALEAITNAERHSAAKTCHVRLAMAQGECPPTSMLAVLHTPVLELDIADDGRGLPPDALNHAGLGLLSMQARAAEVGGICTITSAPGSGTRVSVCLPCPAQSE